MLPTRKDDRTSRAIGPVFLAKESIQSEGAKRSGQRNRDLANIPPKGVNKEDIRARDCLLANQSISP